MGGAPDEMWRSEAPCSLTILKMPSIRAMFLPELQEGDRPEMGQAQDFWAHAFGDEVSTPCELPAQARRHRLALVPLTLANTGGWTRSLPSQWWSSQMSGGV